VSVMSSYLVSSPMGQNEQLVRKPTKFGPRDTRHLGLDGQTVRILLPVANLTADSDAETPTSYSRFLATIDLCRLVSPTVGQMDRQTTHNIVAIAVL